MPGPRFSRNFSSPALPRGAISSMLDSPTGRRAASVFCVATVSRTLAESPSTSRNRASAPSRSSTAMATWSIFLIRIIAPAHNLACPRMQAWGILTLAVQLNLRGADKARAMAAFCLAAGVLGSGGCGNDVHLLELSVSADRRPLTLDIIVSDRGAGQQVLKMAGQTVPMQSGNGPFKVVVYFSSAGRYLVHLVGRPADPPLEIATGVWTVDDHVEASLHMVDLLPGMDADGDTFPACAPGVNPPVIECD